MELLAQILSLFGSVFKSGLGASTTLLCLFHIANQAILFQPKGADNLLSSKAGLSLRVQIFVSLLGPLLSNKNLLSDLRRNNGVLTKRK